MKLKDKNVMIVGVVILVVLVGGLFLLKLKGKQVTTKNGEDVFPTAEILPTVDSSVKVTLTTIDKRGEVLLKVDGIPSGTETIEYELTYNTEGNIEQGALGTPVDVKGKAIYEKKICLCTESSGTKRYHKLSGNKIKVNLKFNATSGSKIFEKEFDI